MGIVEPEVSVSNMQEPELLPLRVRALVASGALHLGIPEHVSIPSHLRSLEGREIVLADDSRHLVPSAGPLVVKVGNRTCLSGPMVRGDRVLPGAIARENMDLVARPATREVVPNPRNPNIAVSVAKGSRS